MTWGLRGVGGIHGRGGAPRPFVLGLLLLVVCSPLFSQIDTVGDTVDTVEVGTDSVESIQPSSDSVADSLTALLDSLIPSSEPPVAKSAYDSLFSVLDRSGKESDTRDAHMQTNDTTRGLTSMLSDSDDDWAPDRLRAKWHAIRSAVARHLPRALLLLLSLGIIVGTVWFFQRTTEKKRFMTNTRLSIMDKEVRRACKHIEKRFDDPELTMEAICEELVTGKAFLDALFHKELGMSVSDFVDQVRINRARLILESKSDADPTWVASQIGFRTMEGFLETFERITGTTYVDYLRAVDARMKDA